MPLILGNPPSGGSRYCIRSNIEDILGVKNVRVYANKDRDGNETKISDRIDRAIVAGSAMIDMMLKGGPYVVPLVYSSDVEVVVVDWAAKLAGMWLYNSAGQQDTITPGADDPIANQYRTMMKEVKADILKVKGDLYRLTAKRAVSGVPIKSYTPSGSNSISADLTWQAYTQAFYGW